MVTLNKKAVISVISINKLAGWLSNERRIWIFAVCLGLCFTLLAAVCTCVYSQVVQADIAGKVIRFHIRANSDSPADQALKTAVKDAVLSRYSAGLSEADTLAQSREFLRQNLRGIQEFAQAEVRGLGYDYPVTARIAEDVFPEKNYSDVTLPAGKYTALRIDIGAARGANWWCIMFPPLCYVDASKPQADARTDALLKTSLTPGEYSLVKSGGGNGGKISIKFKAVELWQELLCSIDNNANSIARTKANVILARK